jgi:hypothetical protein
VVTPPDVGRLGKRRTCWRGLVERRGDVGEPERRSWFIPKLEKFTSALGVLDLLLREDARLLHCLRSEEFLDCLGESDGIRS